MTNIETNEHKSSTFFFPMVLEELQIPILQNAEKYIIEEQFIERTQILKFDFEIHYTTAIYYYRRQNP